MPQEYRDALEQAQNYVDFLNISEEGMRRMLAADYGGNFSPEAVDYAVQHVNVDYNQEALDCARSYQEHVGLSGDRLRSQLESEEFTPEQIDYAMANL